jgi:UDP-N-acetylmuramoylalanine--D-glutamate ligase
VSSPNLNNKKVTILGSQRSALGAARLLSHFGAKILISELDADRFTSEKRLILADIGAEFEFGYHSEDVFDCDFVVVSPGIPEKVDIIQKIRARKIPIYSEIEVTSWFIDAPIIAVTGSNGKTTTVNLIHHLLRTAGYDSYLGGNVGVAASEVLLDSFNKKSEKPIFVLEVSSFQLDNIHDFKPDVGMILNLTPDHLDRYASVDAYFSSKVGMFKNFDANSVAIVNQDDAESMKRGITVENMRYFAVDSQIGADTMLAEGVLGIMREDGWVPILPAKALPLPGRHNLSNALAAVAAVMDFIEDPTIIAQGLMTFTSVPHRIEYVGTVNGISCYNDSKATNIASAEVAINSFNQPLWLILGGKDKGGDFTQLIPLLEDRVKQTLLVGAAAESIKSQIGDAINVLQFDTIDQAVEHCLTSADEGEILLLSPACASFDQYDSFEARGDHFRSIITKQKGWTK